MESWRVWLQDLEKIHCTTCLSGSGCLICFTASCLFHTWHLAFCPAFNFSLAFNYGDTKQRKLPLESLETRIRPVAMVCTAKIMPSLVRLCCETLTNQRQSTKAQLHASGEVSCSNLRLSTRGCGEDKLLTFYSNATSFWCKKSNVLAPFWLNSFWTCTHGTSSRMFTIRWPNVGLKRFLTRYMRFAGIGSGWPSSYHKSWES